MLLTTFDTRLDQFETHKVSRMATWPYNLIHYNQHTFYQCLGVPIGVMVSVGSPIGVPVPPGVGEPDGVPDGVAELVGDGMAVLVGVGDATIAVKKASDVSEHGVTLGMLKVIWISTTWLMALA